MKRLVIGVFAIIGLGIVATGALSADEKAEPKHSIKEVMKTAHKDGLLKKITDGEGRHADAMELLDFYVSLSDNVPPKGDAESWRAKTDALILAAARVSVRRDGAIDQLKKATNCAACHKVHKP